ncbi:hypothetical protein [Marinactinospora rubrisoli]|uniref:UDP-glucuronosyltransferase n=1 Tax=Marinactinospora rubrisoli TaxID=2715399 RepID=A0ABW2KIG8_9ACTN
MIEILTSGVALGVHVPGLLLADRIRERGGEAGVTVLERLLPDHKRVTTEKMKWAFHRDFRVALTGQRIATNPAEVAAEEAVEKLFASWRERRVGTLVVFSGFWLPLVARYVAESGPPPRVHLCHVDSVTSPSFLRTEVTGLDVTTVRLADAERGTIPCSIPVGREPAVPWAGRGQRLLVHGGGWGMGTYRERARELSARGFALDVVAYEARDVTDEAGVRYHMVDPAWHPWLDDGYPPFGRVRPGEPTHYTRGAGHHGSFDLARSAIAMVSKPGGGTLLDSLWSATPMVFLEPFGDHERRNAELWERLGFGVTLARWRETGFAVEVLHEAHRRLLRATADVPDYSTILTETC